MRYAILLMFLVAAPLMADDGEKIDRLIEQLGAEEFKARQSATAELHKLGAKALPALEKALEQTDDPEIRSRCQRLIEKIKGLEPPKVKTPKVRPFGGGRMQGVEELERLMRRLLGEGMRGLRGVPQQKTVVDNTGRYHFERAKDGSFKVTVTKGTDKKEHSFKSEAEMKAKAPVLHEKWGGGGMMRLRIFGPNDMPRELEKLLGKNFRKRMEERQRRIEEMLDGSRKRLEESKKLLESRTLKDEIEKLKQLRPDLEQGELRKEMERLRTIVPERLGEELKKLAPNLDELRKEMEQTMKRHREQLDAVRKRIEEARRVPRMRPIRPRAQPPEKFTNGLRLAAVDPALLAQLGLDGGAVVRAVKQGPDATFGLQVHDIVLSVNGDKIRHPSDYHAALGRYARNQKIAVEILRRGKRQTLEHEFK